MACRAPCGCGRYKCGRHTASKRRCSRCACFRVQACTQTRAKMAMAEGCELLLCCRAHTRSSSDTCSTCSSAMKVQQRDAASALVPSSSLLASDSVSCAGATVRRQSSHAAWFTGNLKVPAGAQCCSRLVHRQSGSACRCKNAALAALMSRHQSAAQVVPARTATCVGGTLQVLASPAGCCNMF